MINLIFIFFISDVPNFVRIMLFENYMGMMVFINQKQFYWFDGTGGS